MSSEKMEPIRIKLEPITVRTLRRMSLFAHDVGELLDEAHHTLKMRHERQWEESLKRAGYSDKEIMDAKKEKSLLDCFMRR